jgi:AraC-like DNA-binding protein
VLRISEAIPSQSGAAVQLLLAHAQMRGLDPTVLAAAARFTWPVRRENRIPLTAYYDLAERVMADLADPCVGLQLGLTATPEVFDVIGFALTTAATFADGLRTLEEFQSVWSEGEHMTLTLGGADPTLELTFAGQPRPAHSLVCQLFAADLCVNAPRHIPGISFRNVDFPGTPPSPEVARLHARLIGFPVTFGGADAMTIGLDPDSLAVAMPLANTGLHAFFRRHLETLSQGLGRVRSFIDRMRETVGAMLGASDSTLVAAAKRLRVSERTLQRRLEANGTTWSDIVDEVRREQAFALLDRGLTVSEVATRLAYSEPRAFTRAFRRWTNLSPMEWRNSRRRPAPR